MAEFVEEKVLTQQTEDGGKSIKNLEIQIKRTKTDLEKSEFKDFIIDRTKSQQEIDTQIDRLADEFQKDESSEESHELAREEYQDAEDLGGMLPGAGRKRHQV